jgi:SAM-dependent methyltransferase
MNTKPCLFNLESYTSNWAHDFYTQAGIWWGEDPHDDPAVHVARATLVERLCGPGNLHILDLGAGSGRTAAALADRGHSVIGVELNPTDVGYASSLLKTGRAGSLAMVHADYYTVQLEGRFDVVCWWQGFGLGSDADQRRMLRRIADEWLSDGGCALIDVYNPTWPARHAGQEVLLEPLPDVPGSVEMIERCYFDPVYCRWIDEWQPTQAPHQALAQTLRCYTPADLLLLLEGTGLALKRVEFEGQEIDFQSQKIVLSETLLEAWGYLAQLVAANDVACSGKTGYTGVDC